MKAKISVFLLLLVNSVLAAFTECGDSGGSVSSGGNGGSGSEKFHPKRSKRNSEKIKSNLLDEEHWREIGQETLRKHLSRQLNRNVAKNVIFFLGDGMSGPTVTAARIYKGQTGGSDGEADSLSFEEFPFIGAAKTYCVDAQVADSACSSTAYLSGAKANEGTIGVTGRVARTDCSASGNVSNHVHSIATWAQKAGKSTGFATTTRVTHASPAGLYAHVAERDWEDDVGVERDDQNATQCPDIAQQLIRAKPGIDFNVIMGGGRRYFYPREFRDGEGISGRRKDGKNLIQEWERDKINRNSSYAYITTRNQLLTLKEVPDYLLGLFAPSHMNYHLEANANEPLLEEMTAVAIKVLQKNPKGFFLFVEGGKIDLAHHDNLARVSLDETVEFSKAVSAALKLTNETDTLIVVTADHAHVMSISGYAKRGDNIFGFAGEGSDGLSYPTLSYANGPGFWRRDLHGNRLEIPKSKLEKNFFRFPAMVPLPKETHGGDDVGVYARGPWSHLFSGSYEQNFIPHALGYASCLGKGMTICQQQQQQQHEEAVSKTRAFEDSLPWF